MIDTFVSVPQLALAHVKRHRTNDQTQTPGAFAESLVADYLQLKPFLPQKVDRILDIGCGMAGIDVLLKRRFPAAELYLLDGDGDDKRAGWNETLEAFSSRSAAEELLSVNGIFVDRWYDINTKEPMEADLVVSLASWGYHYPIKTYNVTGFCIADLRKGKEPKRGRVIMEYPKRFRCAWEQVC